MKKILILLPVISLCFSNNYIIDEYNFIWKVSQYRSVEFSVVKNEHSSYLTFYKKDFDSISLTAKEAIKIGEELSNINTIYTKLNNSQVDEIQEKVNLSTHFIIYDLSENFTVAIYETSDDDINFISPFINLSKKEALAMVPYLLDSENLINYTNKEIDLHKTDFSYPDIEKFYDTKPHSHENEPIDKFIPYDQAPIPKIPLRKLIIYPKKARIAGIEGKIFVKAFINNEGIVTVTKIVKGLPNTGLDEAALDAIKKSTWYPASQRDKKVGVWTTIPVDFSLTTQKIKGRHHIR